MIERRNFAHNVGSIPLARRFVEAAFHEAPREIAERAAVMASELATNAMRHARSDFVVQIETTPVSIRVEIIDTGAGSPTVRDLGARAPSGRGLRIVNSLADEWGVIPHTTGPGKAVWFWLFLATSNGEQPPLSSLA